MSNETISKQRVVFSILAIYIVMFVTSTLLHCNLNDFVPDSLILFVATLGIVYVVVERYLNHLFKKLDKARFLLDNTNDAVYVIDLQNANIVDVNKRATTMLGYSKEELLSKKITDIRTSMRGEKVIQWGELARNLKINHFMTLEVMHIHKNGSLLPIDANLSYIEDEGKGYIIAVARDISNKVALEKKIKSESDKIKSLQDVISQSVLYTASDLSGRITSISKAFEVFSGYKESEVIGKNHSIFKDPDTPKEFYKYMWDKLQNNETFVGELKNYTKNSKPQWIKLTINPLYDEEGNKTGYSSYRENITDKKELEYLSTHDTLTGVFNREYFQQKLQEYITNAIESGKKFGFVMMDIDYFKKINDTFGHFTGDEVLKSISQVVTQSIEPDDIFARWGGEEFIIITQQDSPEALEALIRTVQTNIANTPFTPVPKVTVSFGITLYQTGDTLESLQKRADTALYEAKHQGRDRFCFLPLVEG